MRDSRSGRILELGPVVAGRVRRLGREDEVVARGREGAGVRIILQRDDHRAGVACVERDFL